MTKSFSKNRSFKKNNQSGFTLVEILVVMAVAILLTLFVLIMNGTLTGYVNAYRNATLTQTHMQNIEQAWQGSTTYSGITTAQVAQPSLINGKYLNGTAITNVYGAAVDVGAGNANGLSNNMLLWTDNGVRQKGCSFYVSTLADGMDFIAVNGTTVKPVNGNLDSAATTTQCSSGNTSTVQSGKIKTN